MSRTSACSCSGVFIGAPGVVGPRHTRMHIAGQRAGQWAPVTGTTHRGVVGHRSACAGRLSAKKNPRVEGPGGCGVAGETSGRGSSSAAGSRAVERKIHPRPCEGPGGSRRADANNRPAPSSASARPRHHANARNRPGARKRGEKAIGVRAKKNPRSAPPGATGWPGGLTRPSCIIGQQSPDAAHKTKKVPGLGHDGPGALWRR